MKKDGGKSKKPGPGKTAGPSGRGLSVRVKTAKKRTSSSTWWLGRQLNDPYVLEAKKLGYRSRAAFKILQLDEKFHFLKPGARVVDLGAAPGGWTQIAAAKVLKSGPKGAQGRVVGIDILPMDPVPGATVLHLDFTLDEAPGKLMALLDGPADVVLSDMAASATGHTQTDHLKIVYLAELALDFACRVLTPGGIFIAKVLQGGAESQLLTTLKRHFTTVKHVKPEASRKESAEIYVVALGFRGATAGNRPGIAGPNSQM